MTPNPAPARRVPSTPYARRLARERGIAITAFAGTGPNGRVTGDDVMHFVPLPERSPLASAESSPRTMAMPAALAAGVDLTAVRNLLRDLVDAAPGIEIVDVCLKATTTALRLTPGFGVIAGTDGNAGIILLGAGRGARALRGLGRLTLSAIAAARKDEPAAAVSADEHAAVSMSWIGRAGIRPVAMPIAAGSAARLVIAADAAAGPAECLLVYDTERIDDTAAADFLLAFKTCMEIPLRLIA